MLRHALAALAISLALPLKAVAGLLPAYFDVAGVPAGEVLDLRAAPDTGAAVLGHLPANRRNVEIVALSENGKWGLMAYADGSAWVAMKFLKRAERQADETLPEKLGCFGNEPFWALRLNGDSGVFDELEGQAVPMTRQWSGPPQGGAPQSFGLVLKGADGAALHGVISRGLCSDGMSERPFGYSIRAILSGSLGARMLAGCCTLP